MGRIYAQLKQNIDLLNDVDRRLRNVEHLNMHEIWEVQKAILNIKHVIDYADSAIEGAVGEGRFDTTRENHSFNIPKNFEAMVNEWEEQLDNEQVNDIVEHLQANQRVPSYSPEINEPDPFRYLNYIHQTLDNIVPTVTQGHFGPTREAFKDLVISARIDYVNTALEQNFVIDPNVVRVNDEICQWLDAPHARYMGDVDANSPVDFNLSGQMQIRNYEAEEGLDSFRERFAQNLPLAKAVSNIENADSNVHALADAIKNGFEKYPESSKNHKYTPLGKYLSIAREKLEEKVLFGELDLSDENEDCKFLREYLIDPVEGLAKYYDDKAASQGINGAAGSRERARRARAERNNYDQANRDKKNDWDLVENNRRDAFEMHIREDYPDFDRTQLGREFQGGFMERKILHSTSQEWKDVEAAFAGWDRNGPEKGNLGKVAYPAMAYLRHKFPNTRVEDITPDMARSLSGAGSRRALFCLSVVDAAARAQEDTIEGQRELTEAKIREFEQRAGIVHEEPVNNNIINNDIQNDFQESLKNDIEPNNNIIKQESKASNEEIHNENDIVIGEDE